jgi:hypothetical protein
MYIHRCSRYCSDGEWEMPMRASGTSIPYMGVTTYSSFCKSFKHASILSFRRMLQCYPCFINMVVQRNASGQGHMERGLWTNHATVAEQELRPPPGEPRRCRCSTSSWQRCFCWSPHRLAAICPGAVLCQSIKHVHKVNKLSWPRLCLHRFSLVCTTRT